MLLKRAFCLHTPFCKTRQNRLKSSRRHFSTPEQKDGRSASGVLHHTDTQPITFHFPFQSVLLPHALSKTARFCPFLHTFSRAESTHTPQRKSKHSTLSWPTLHVVLADAPCSIAQNPVFRPLFRHFGKCAKTDVMTSRRMGPLTLCQVPRKKSQREISARKTEKNDF